MGARWSVTTKRAVVAGFVVLAIVLLWRAGDIVQPFIWGLIVAYILLPVVGALERRFAVPRTLAALVVFVAMVAIIVSGSRLIIPRVAENAGDLQKNWPVLLANVQQTISNTFDQLGLSDLDDVLIGPNVDDIERQLAAMAQRTALPFVVSLGHFLLEFLVFLIATFLLLRDAPRLYEFVRRNLPNRQRREIVQVLGETNVMLGRYIRGQFLLVDRKSTRLNSSHTVISYAVFCL